MRAGLEHAELLGVGHGYVEGLLTAERPWGGPLTTSARIEAGFRPLSAVELFAEAQADTVGLSAGAGVRVTL